MERAIMNIEPNLENQLGVTVRNFKAESASNEEIQQLKDIIYREKLMIIKDQDLSPQQYSALGRRFGEPEPYYQPMYHHPEEKSIFVSSNVCEDDHQIIGVPKTGKFWHVDYAFMPRPFAFTMVYQCRVPSRERGTHYINMSDVFDALPDDLKSVAQSSYCYHSVRRYFKIRPCDMYRPLSEVAAEVERETPPVKHPTTFKHPVTGETVLFINEGFTYQIEDIDGTEIEQSMLDKMLDFSGQCDATFTHPTIHTQAVNEKDLVIWDNRTLVHCAKHVQDDEPTVAYRLTLHDSHPFFTSVQST
jgi:taurine dioxygenase